MTDYTPGPWLSPSASASTYGFPRWEVGFQDGDCLGAIAKVLPSEVKGQRQANAELIASAPRLKEEKDELLVMLKDVVNNWGMMSEEKARELIERIDRE